jgi:hypothetical protein
VDAQEHRGDLPDHDLTDHHGHDLADHHDRDLADHHDHETVDLNLGDQNLICRPDLATVDHHLVVDESNWDGHLDRETDDQYSGDLNLDDHHGHALVDHHPVAVGLRSTYRNVRGTDDLNLDDRYLAGPNLAGHHDFVPGDRHGFGPDEHRLAAADPNLDDHHGYVMACHHLDVDDQRQDHHFDDQMTVVRWAENRLGADDVGRDLEKAFVVF